MTDSASSPRLQLSWHALPPEEVVTQLQTDAQAGLTAEQAAERLAQLGPNELVEGDRRSNWQILRDQFANVMLLMLIAVALISAGLDIHQGLQTGSLPFPKDAIAIFTVVFLNAALGFFQERGAEKALQALRRYAAQQVQVVRSGQRLLVDASALVPGDLCLLEAGDRVPADGRLLEAVNLQTREASLTGEAEGVLKDASAQFPAETLLGDRDNCVFAGTDILQGRGLMFVTATGMATELGKIAAALQSVQTEPTPLQKRMTQLGQVLVSGSLILVGLVIGGGLWLGPPGLNFGDLVEVSLSMAVAVVPEGLPAVITVTLALGTQRMVRRQALIRRLPAVETLGSVTAICSDKTGTLTQNRMVVRQLALPSQAIAVSGNGYAPEGGFQTETGEVLSLADHELRSLLAAALLCSDAVLQQAERDWEILGDPTEGALVTAAAKAGFWRMALAADWPRVAELPFNADRKRMSVVVTNGQATLLGTEAPLVLISKGSPELLLPLCQSIRQGDRTLLLTNEHRAHIQATCDRWASQGLRLLGVAMRSLESTPKDVAAAEEDLIWLGLFGMQDPPRPQAQAAVEKCRAAGIRPLMITGDHPLTARAIAAELGIADLQSSVVTGRELETMSAAELSQSVREVSVYARVSPEHKLRIVQSLQQQGQIVAMTGDGVNDAPALKQADIGVAMGITGTDVSQEASDMVLLDDNFSTIVAAVEEGRVVYGNIRRFIRYILGSNVGEVLTIASAPLLGLSGVPLSPLQILWMNLVTDGVPALALAVEPGQPNTMRRPPHDPREGIFARGLGNYIVRIGIVLAIIAIALMIWAYQHCQIPVEGLSPDRWKTMVFTVLCLSQMGHAIAVRSKTELTLKIDPFSNPALLWSVLLTSGLQLLLVYWRPLQIFFGTQPISSMELLICLGFSSLVFVWIELEKLVISRWEAR
ncbi:cation-translocating P-type ATPase [Synechococcus elongatus]|uniref:cation-translocating P-type ATPase n=1 Tax=Synechococcus elongatus TaxID=32046 RepID=UPI0030CE3E1D